MSSSPKAKKLKTTPVELTYFDSAGRAELSRLLFTIGGIPFTDTRVAKEAFKDLKPTLPLEQLPILNIDGDVYPQSMAIARYAARIAGLYPTDPLEVLSVEMAIESLLEVQQAVVDTFLLTKDEDEKAEKKKTLTEQTLPKIFGLLEERQQGKFFTGEQMTIADVLVFDVIVNAITPLFAEFDLAAFPKLEATIEAIKTTPSVEAYLSKKE